jgi:hypothetical protein
VAWWDRDVIWDLYFGLVAVVTSVVILGAAARPMAARVGAIALMAVIFVWYAAWRRTLFAPGGATWRRYVYLTGTTVLFAAAVALVDAASFLLLMLCPQAYFVLPRLRATVAVVVVSVVYLGVIVVQTGDPATLLEGP